MNNIMVDLETMGTRPNAAIIAIGAARFDNTGLKEEFHMLVDLQSSVAAGLAVDKETVAWWAKQSKAAKKQLDEPGEQLEVALTAFANWVGEDVVFWGNGAAFDNVILRSAYMAIQATPPWKHWNDRCYRTMLAILPKVKSVSFKGTPHNALDDAKNQARHLIRVCNASGIDLGG